MATNLAEILRPTTRPVTAQEVTNNQPAPQQALTNTAPIPDQSASAARVNSQPSKGNALQRFGESLTQNPMLFGSLLGIGATLSGGGTIPQALLNGLMLVGMAGRARDDRVKREQSVQSEQQRLEMEGERVDIAREGQRSQDQARKDQTEYNQQNLALRAEDQKFDREYKLASLNEQRAAHGASLGMQRANLELRLQDSADEKEYKKNALAISLYGQMDKDIAALYADPLADPADIEGRVSKRIELTNQRLEKLGLPRYDPGITGTEGPARPTTNSPDTTASGKASPPDAGRYSNDEDAWVNSEFLRSGIPKDQLRQQFRENYTKHYGIAPPVADVQTSKGKEVAVPVPETASVPTLSPQEIRSSFSSINQLTTTAATVADLQRALSLAEKVANSGQDPTGRAQFYVDNIKLRITNAGQPPQSEPNALPLGSSGE